MANETNKFNIRIVNKNDTLANWESSSVVLKKGEIALAEVTTVDPKTSLTVPTYLMKIGDGENVFSDLKWLHAPAADVYPWAKKENPTVDELPENLQTAIKDLQAAIGEDGSVADAIANAINALDVTDEAVEGQFVTAVKQEDGKISVTRTTLKVSDVVGLQDALGAKLESSVFEEFQTSNNEAIADAKKAGTDATAALNEYKTSNDQAVANAASAAAKAQEEVDAVEERVTTVEGKVTTLIGDDTNKSVRTIANEELVKQLIAEGADESLDTLQEIAAWIQSHPDDASAMNEAIVKLQNIVAGIGGDTDEYATVVAYVDAAIAALKIGDYATAQQLTELAGRVTTLEGKSHEHSNKDLLDTYTQTEADLADAVAKKHNHENGTVLDTITSEKVAAWDVAAERNISDLVQDENTYIVLDCGSSTVNI